MSRKPSVDVDEVMKALANPVRREILAWLKNPEKEFKQQDHPYEFGVCVGKIYERTGLSQSTVSTHLSILQGAGLVTQRKVGQWVFYKRDEEAIRAFLDRIGHEL
jgi:DNA-binding transcriptional ArsR family regulator